MNKVEKILLVLLAVVLLISTIWVYILVDFYNDWKCSTTTDIKWFIENNCQRYMDGN